MPENNLKYDILIVGGGAAGIMAASSAAIMGLSCLLLESGPRLGRKLLITGKGRCNITNNCTTEDILENVRRNKNFLYSSIYTFTNEQIVDFFETRGVKTKVERGGRVFPVSDKASDVVEAMERELSDKNVTVKKNTKITELIINDSQVLGVLDSNRNRYYAEKVILACGGASYPTTGSDGNGYKLVGKTGHSIVEPRGVLTGLNSSDEWVKSIMGLSLKNVNLSIIDNGRSIFSMQGEMLFTHFGISGPIVLTASSSLFESKFKEVYAVIDLKPALDEEKLDKRLIRDFNENSRKDFSNSLDALLPKKLIPIIIALSEIDKDKKVNQITAVERKRLVELLKGLKLRITGSRPVSEAIVTAGGVAVDEINPSTMESKIVKNLYICGEMLDVDANTGGYNLTIAFSTGYLAGISAAGGF